MSPTALASCQGDVDQLVVGCEDGVIYCANRKCTSYSLGAPIQAHKGPVTSIHVHPASEAPQADLSHLAASSSMDCTCRVWDRKTGRHIVTLEGGSSEYVLDVQWSPVHAGLLATGDAAGLLQLWDLSTSTDAPVEEFVVGERGAGGGGEEEEDTLVLNGIGEGARSIHRLGWSCDGRFLACGDSGGRVHMIPLGNEAFDVPAAQSDQTLALLSAAQDLGVSGIQ